MPISGGKSSFEAKAVLIGGKLDTRRCKVSKSVLLGSTGIFLDSVAGEVSGLADEAPGTKFKAAVTGHWGPKILDKALLKIDDVSFTAETPSILSVLPGLTAVDSVKLAGAVSLLDKDIAQGKVDLCARERSLQGAGLRRACGRSRRDRDRRERLRGL